MPTIQQQNNLILKMDKGPEQTFVQRRYIQMANKHMELLILRKMQIKTMKRHYFTTINMAIIKQQKTSVVQGVEKLKLL